MIAVLPGHDGRPARWRLTSRTGTGSDVLATAPLAGDGRASGWQQAVERLRDGDGTLRVSATSDGHYGWALTDTAGAIIAQSPPAHRDADSCRRAFALARRAARAVVGGTVPRPTVPQPTVPQPTVPQPTVPQPTVSQPTVPRPTAPLAECARS
jgi:hypothetical protein